MSFDRERAKRHGSGNEVLHDAFHGFYLVERGGCGSFGKAQEVAQENRALLVINACRPFLKFLVRTQSGGYLQIGYSLRSPRVVDAVLAIVEKSGILQEIALLVVETLVVESNSILGDVAQSDTANGRYLSAEIFA